MRDLFEGKTITIPVHQFISLYIDQQELNELEIGGVDNWEWYGEALDKFDREELEKTLIETLKQDGVI